ncbi:MAG: sulfate adenylyltransferase [Chloroflexales bacterium]|nr:sulfate adenylyltransferase [Chloroflexales bacterium]
MHHLAKPHGGTLKNLIVDDHRADELREASRDWPSWDLTPRQLCDLELLVNGGFSPLGGFLTQADYDPVCRDMRLASGTLWPIPVTLDVPAAFADTVSPGTTVALRDAEGVMLAALQVEDVFRPDRTAEAESVYGTANPEHPGVAPILDDRAACAIGGRIEAIRMPSHYDFRSIRLGPAEVRAVFERRGWRQVVAFQTRNPMHRAHYELTRRAADQLNANLFLHPVVGMTKPGDLDHYTRVRCYQALTHRYPPQMAELALLPLAMRMAGPREALWHALIRRNYGANHLSSGATMPALAWTRPASRSMAPTMLRIWSSSIAMS